MERNGRISQTLGRAPRRAVVRLVAFASMAGCAVSLAAQSAQQVLPPTREEVTRPLTQSPSLSAPQLEVEGGVERAPCALDAPQYSSIHFTLRGAQFDAVQGLSPEQLATAYTPWVGHDVPISIVCEIRDRAATMLRDAGYYAAVQVPEQHINGGVVRFHVLMAHLTQVRVRGDARGAERLIASYLNHLSTQPVFNRYQAERYLLLAADVPGYTVHLTLRPAGTAPGDVVGDVTVHRTRGYAEFNVQNGGSKELGPWGALLRGEVYGLTGLGDRTTFSVFSTSDLHEQQTVQLGHEFRLGSQGLGISGTGTYAWARPSIPNANVTARTLLGTLEVGYPLLRRQAQTMRGSVGMDYVNQDVDLDKIKLTRDRLRVAYARIGFEALNTDFSRTGRSFAEPAWRLNALLELRQGLHILGATPECGPTGANCLGSGGVPPSRVEGRSDATVARGTVYGELRPIPKVTFALGLRGQYSHKPVLSFEEFSAGNYTAGRGYDPGALLGASGIGSQAEVRLGSRFPSRARAAAIEAYTFWDHAGVWNPNRLFIVKQSNHLNSIGAGARVGFDRFALDAALAIPLTRVGLNYKRPGPRVLISLTTRLWPWSYR